MSVGGEVVKMSYWIVGKAFFAAKEVRVYVRTVGGH